MCVCVCVCVYCRGSCNAVWMLIGVMAVCGVLSFASCWLAQLPVSCPLQVSFRTTWQSLKDHFKRAGMCAAVHTSHAYAGGSF